MWKLIKQIPATWIIIAGLAVSLFFVRDMYVKERAERIRYEGNQKVLLEGFHTYKVRDSLNAARVDALNLTVKEFKNHFVDLNGLVKDMNIKINRLQSVSTVGTSTVYNITTPVKDSLIYLDTPETIQRINYADQWLSFSGIIENKQLTANFQSRDTLVQVIHRVPRKFLFIRYGTKGIRQEVVSKNPYSKITFDQFLKFEK